LHKTNAATGKLIAATTAGGDAGGDVAPLKFTTLLQVSGVNNSADFLMANPNVAQVAYSLPQTAALSFGVADGGAYANGHAFTVVAVGDIAADPDGGGGGAVFNTKFFHFLALPNAPAVKTFDPSK
jgi:hypothetical protein